MKPKKVVIKSPDLNIDRVFTNEQQLLKFLRHVKKSFGQGEPTPFIKQWTGEPRTLPGGQLKISIFPVSENGR